MEQLAIKLDEVKQKKKSGFFKYTDYYSHQADNIFISTITSQRKVRIHVTSPDGIYTRGNYLLNDNELKMILNMITLAWQNHGTDYICGITSNKKHIVVKTEKSTVKMEKNKHMTIKINNKIMAYGFDINDSRRLYKLLRDLYFKKESDLLS